MTNCIIALGLGRRSMRNWKKDRGKKKSYVLENIEDSSSNISPGRKKSLEERSEPADKQLSEGRVSHRPRTQERGGGEGAPSRAKHNMPVLIAKQENKKEVSPVLTLTLFQVNGTSKNSWGGRTGITLGKKKSKRTTKKRGPEFALM